MKFILTEDVPVTDIDVVFKYSWRPVIMGYVVFGVFLLVFVFSLIMIRIPFDRFDWYQVVFLLFGVLLYLVYSMLAKYAENLETTRNWLIRIGAKNIYINLCSCFGKAVPTKGVDVLELQFNEIFEIKETALKASSANKKFLGQLFNTNNLELIINDREVLNLKEFLKRKINDLGFVSTFFIDQRGSIFISWSGVTPQLKEAIAVIQERIQRSSLKQKDFEDLSSKDRGESVILQLVRNGEQMKAVIIAKESLGLSVEEARKLVETLTKQIQDDL